MKARIALFTTGVAVWITAVGHAPMVAGESAEAGPDSGSSQADGRPNQADDEAATPTAEGESSNAGRSADTSSDSSSVDYEQTNQPPSPSPERLAEINRWAEQLDDDQFAARQWAQRRLQNAGLAALPTVAKTAREGSLEASHRAVDLLIAWADTEDHRLRILALEQLATLAGRPTESALAKEALADVRQAAALARLRAAGAVIVADKGSLPTHRNQLPLQIVIGPHWRGGEAALADLAEVHTAAAVSFHSAPIGESAVPYLVKLDHIQRLEFFGTTISNEAVETLKAELPALRQVEIRPGGAQLGIEGSTQQLGKQGAYVHVVHGGSAAARAGLQSRDLITEIDGQEVADFRALTQKIAHYQPGDSAQLVVQRRGQAVTLEVQFDRWGEAPHPGAIVVPEASEPAAGIRGRFPREIVPAR